MTYKIPGRFVEYFDKKEYLTNDENYISADKDGSFYAFQNKPTLGNNIWDPFDGSLCRKLGKVDLENDDWKESLKHFPN